MFIYEPLFNNWGYKIAEWLRTPTIKLDDLSPFLGSTHWKELRPTGCPHACAIHMHEHTYVHTYLPKKLSIHSEKQTNFNLKINNGYLLCI